MLNMKDKLFKSNVITVKEACEFLGYTEEIFEDISTDDFEDELEIALDTRFRFNLERFGDDNQMERCNYINKF